MKPTLKVTFDNNLSTFNEKENQKEIFENENYKKYMKLQKKMLNEGIKDRKLKKEPEEKKNHIINEVYKTRKFINNFINFSTNEQKLNKTDTKNNEKNEIQKIKINSRNLKNKKNFKIKNLNNEITIKLNNKDKSNNIKAELAKIIRRSYEKMSDSKNDNKILRISTDYHKYYNNNIKKKSSPETQRDEKIKQIQNYTKPIKNYIRIKTYYFSNYSKNNEKPEEENIKKEKKNSFQVTLKKYCESNPKENKNLSRRRYYQNLLKNSKEKSNDEKKGNNNISNNISNEPLDNTNEEELNTNINIFHNSIPLKNKINISKDFNIKSNTSILKTNTNTNNDNNINLNINNSKDENQKESNNINNNDDDLYSNIINIADFDIKSEGTNIIPHSKINSIDINEIDNQFNSLYNPEKLEEIIQKCTIPTFEDIDFCYNDSIGEGAFGTIYEVEEIKSGKKYAIKKIICKDVQELIQQKSQLELLYSFENDNIMKIYKVQIKVLDFTTFSINVLMELALKDWNQDILDRIKNNNYYKEEELINIIKQIINGLLYLKNKNISHRDIKPQNILIFPNNCFKLADFGEAKTIKNLHSLRTLKGCQLYMSPALYTGFIHGKRSIKHNIYKSDIFSLGLCLLYAITLNINILEEVRNTDDNNNILNIIIEHIKKDLYSQEFLNIVYKMVSINEEERYDIENELNEIEKLKF